MMYNKVNNTYAILWAASGITCIIAAVVLGQIDYALSGICFLKFASEY